jgi:hypothetical protein
MATPVIDSITVQYPAGQTSLAPGQTADVVVMAHDGDSQTVQVAVEVTDAQGNKGNGQVPVVISDPVTYSATAPSGTITGGGTSNIIKFKA